MNRFALAAFAMSLFFPTALAAEPATKTGADELKTTLRSFLGGSNWAIQVVPVAESYTVIVDPAALAEGLSVTGFRGRGSTLTLSVTDNGDGTWAYALDQPVYLFYSLPGIVPVECMFHIGNVSLTGVFDEALGLPRQSRLEATEASTQCNIANPDPRIRTLASDQSTKSWIVESSAVAGSKGVDLSIHSTNEQTFFTIMVPIAEQNTWKAKGALADSTTELSVTGLRSRNILDLWAWALGHSAPEEMAAGYAGLKTQIEAALPIFSDFTVTSTYQGISLNTPQGVFGAKEIKVSGGANGIVADARFHEGIEVKGPVLPDDLVPDFAKGLVPTDLSLGFTVTDFDPSGAAYVLLKMLDQPLGSPPPVGFEEALLASLLPNGAVTVTLDAGAVTGRDYKLTYEGALTAGPAQPDPTFTARLALTGMEAIRTAMQSAPTELELGTAAMGLGAMGGLAKPGAGGELVWEISLDETGAVLVNGRDVEKIFGNQ